jgi:hypothetical protein
MAALAYDALPIGRRLKIEREIYQRIFGVRSYASGTNLIRSEQL